MTRIKPETPKILNWLDDDNDPTINLNRIRLQLNHCEVENWMPILEPPIVPSNDDYIDRNNFESPKLELIIGSSKLLPLGATTDYIESSMVFAKDILFSPGASWMVSFLFLAAGIGWVFYSIGRIGNQIGKEVNIAKIVSNVFQTQARATELIKELSESNIRSERKIDAALSEIGAVKNDVRELYSRVQDVRKASKETGDELSGQLHGIERDLDNIEKVIANK